MNKLTPYERKVNYYETDKMAIVHHSNYIRIFEEARVHYLAEAGMPFDEVEKLGILMPCLSVNVNYKHPLVFNEPFAVYLKIDSFNGTTIKISYKVISRRSGELCADGSSSHCFTNTELKPLRTRHSHPEFYEKLAQYLGLDFDI